MLISISLWTRFWIGIYIYTLNVYKHLILYFYIYIYIILYTLFMQVPSCGRTVALVWPCLTINLQLGHGNPSTVQLSHPAPWRLGAVEIKKYHQVVEMFYGLKVLIRNDSHCLTARIEWSNISLGFTERGSCQRSRAWKKIQINVYTVLYVYVREQALRLLERMNDIQNISKYDTASAVSALTTCPFHHIVWLWFSA